MRFFNTEHGGRYSVHNRVFMIVKQQQKKKPLLAREDGTKIVNTVFFNESFVVSMMAKRWNRIRRDEQRRANDDINEN